MVAVTHVGAGLLGRRGGFSGGHGRSIMAKRAKIAPSKANQSQKSISKLIVFVMMDGNGKRLPWI
jgi:hypothetical protein